MKIGRGESFVWHFVVVRVMMVESILPRHLVLK